MNICLFAAFATPPQPLAEEIARLVAGLASHGHTIVTGGMGGEGTMNLIGSAALAAGGSLLTIYPRNLTHHASHQHPAHTHLPVEDLAERLQEMISRSDAFITLPGGIGTIHEAVQVWAEMRMGYFEKSLHFFNYDNFFTPFQTFIETTISHGYTKPELASRAHFHPTVESLLATFS